MNEPLCFSHSGILSFDFLNGKNYFYRNFIILDVGRNISHLNVTILNKHSAFDIM